MHKLAIISCLTEVICLLNTPLLLTIAVLQLDAKQVQWKSGSPETRYNPS